MKIDPSVKNLIFDLGGVIIDLSVDHTLQAFAELSGYDKKKINHLYGSAPEFLLYEKGLISDDEFRFFIGEVFTTTVSPDEIDTAWNAMLRGLPVPKLHLLETLKLKYNVFLLSNTNAIHLKYINEVMIPGTGEDVDSLDDYFHRSYYSHLMKKRKPDAEIFEQVLKESELNPNETLFLDDNKDNVEGAKKIGIKTAFVDTPNYIIDYFHEH